MAVKCGAKAKDYLVDKLTDLITDCAVTVGSSTLNGLGKEIVGSLSPYVMEEGLGLKDILYISGLSVLGLLLLIGLISVPLFLKCRRSRQQPEAHPRAHYEPAETEPRRHIQFLPYIKPGRLEPI